MTLYAKWRANDPVGPVGPADSTDPATLTLGDATDSSWTEYDWDEYSGNALSQTGDPLSGWVLLLLFLSAMIVSLLLVTYYRRCGDKR